MGIEFEWPEGATPIDADEAVGLIPSLSTQAELNIFEAIDIGEAMNWAFGNKRFLRMLLTEEALRRLHRKMFERTWKWAGTYRRTEKNIGVEPYRIAVEVRNLLADVECWLQYGSYSAPEIAARFHHRLAEIHPFPNGNGRHARFATDLLCQRQGWPLSIWGASDLVQAGDVRAEYMRALRLADARDFEPLIAFMAIQFSSQES